MKVISLGDPFSQDSLFRELVGTIHTVDNGKKLIPIATMCEKECRLAKCEVSIQNLLDYLEARGGNDDHLQNLIEDARKLLA